MTDGSKSGYIFFLIRSSLAHTNVMRITLVSVLATRSQTALQSCNPKQLHSNAKEYYTTYILALRAH